MKSDGTERPQPDPSWTDFNEEIEKHLFGDDFEQIEAGPSLRIAKCILFLCMVLFPAAYIGSCVYAQQSYRRPINPKPPELPPRPADAPKYEQPVLDLVKPAMLEKYALKDFDVMYLAPESGLRIRIRTDETRGPRMSQAFGIMQDIREMRRTVPNLPACAWALEFDHDAPDYGMTIILPDAKRGCEAFPEWHIDALYTDAPTTTGKAQP